MKDKQKKKKKSGKELNETDISSLSDKEFKVIVIKMLIELGRGME